MQSLDIDIMAPDRPWTVHFEPGSEGDFQSLSGPLFGAFRATASDGIVEHRSYWGIDDEFRLAHLIPSRQVPEDLYKRAAFYLSGIVRFYRRHFAEILARDSFKYVFREVADVDMFVTPKGGTYLDRVEREIEDLLFRMARLPRRVGDYLPGHREWSAAEPHLREATTLHEALREFYDAYAALRHESAALRDATGGYSSIKDIKKDIMDSLRSESAASDDLAGIDLTVRRVNSLGHLALRKIAEAQGRAPGMTPRDTQWQLDASRQTASDTSWWLRQVTLERFKAAFQPDPIPLEPFTVIIGRNGSGKSTLLEALQWLDTSIRRDIRDASDRYYGVHNLINRKDDTAYFRVQLTWNEQDADRSLTYDLRIEEHARLPVVASEQLEQRPQAGSAIIPGKGGRRTIQDKAVSPELLSLRYIPGPGMDLVEAFWLRAVFLRLSPSRLAQGAPPARKSFEPLLDEEGQSLPALLSELGPEQRQELVANLQDVLILDIEDLTLSPSDVGQQLSYSLDERMVRSDGKSTSISIPAWMLSEGTRRLTAIFALLLHDPPPSLLCIEEIENGLDPWTVRAVLQHLQSAVDRGTQVIVTTHSPWVLDDVPMDSILQVRRVGGDVRYEHFASRPEVQAYDPSVPAGTRYVQESE
jgi:predicted ATPase